MFIWRWHLKQWMVLILIGLPLFRSSSVPLAPQQKDLNLISLTQADRNAIQNGDLIFRKATGFGSDFLLTVDSDSEFSHVGLIHKIGDRIYVIHAAPFPQDNEGLVLEEEIDTFLVGIPLAAIYRIQNYPTAVTSFAVREALSFVGNRKFDFNFELSETGDLYCTELVWLAYKHAGLDLLDGHYEFLSLPLLGEGNYILPSHLIQSRWLYQINIFKSNVQ